MTELAVIKELEDQIIDLKQDLEIARRTNTKLNQRVQDLEHLVSLRTDANLTEMARGHLERAVNYANEVRNFYYEKQSFFHDNYKKHWSRLPKAKSKKYDGIQVRVDETLRLLNEYNVPYDV